MEWLIYTLKNPRTQEVRYVGWTSRTLEQRLADHVKESLGGREGHTYKNRWILSLVSIGLFPVIEAIESGSGDGWEEAERRWIARYLADGARLTNRTIGGDNPGAWGTFEERSAAARKRWAGRTTEERAAIAKKIHANELPGQRQEWMKKARESQTREQLAANARKGGPVKTAKRTASRSGASTKANKTRWANMTAEERIAYVLKCHGNRTTEERRASARKSWDALTPEERKERAKNIRANFTPEQHKAAGQKAAATWRARRQNGSH